MRYLLLPLLVTIILASCTMQQPEDSNTTQEPLVEETPQALQESERTPGSFSKYKRGSILDALYKEQVDNDNALRDLEDKINRLYNAKDDSIAAFMKYDNKNNSYYNSADNIAQYIKDSSLKNQIAEVIKKSVANYERSISADTILLNSINKQYIRLDDMYTILKIVTTLPMIETYQKNEHPSESTMKEYLQELKETNSKIEDKTKVK